MMVGTISEAPLGTWMRISTGSSKPETITQVDISHAKITEKGKPRKRYDLREGMKVRVRGLLSRIWLSADTVEILGRSAPKKGAAGHRK
jgi:hypothetical protein